MQTSSARRPRTRRALALAAATAALLAAPLAPSGARAAEAQHFLLDTAADLARLCGSPAASPNHDAAIHMCQGYIIGVHHFHEALAAEMGESVYCVGAGDGAAVPSRDAVMAAFVDWLGANPDAAEEEAMTALLRFAADSYPCN